MNTARYGIPSCIVTRADVAQPKTVSACKGRGTALCAAFSWSQGALRKGLLCKHWLALLIGAAWWCGPFGHEVPHVSEPSRCIALKHSNLLVLKMVRQSLWALWHTMHGSKAVYMVSCIPGHAVAMVAMHLPRDFTWCAYMAMGRARCQSLTGALSCQSCCWCSVCGTVWCCTDMLSSWARFVAAASHSSYCLPLRPLSCAAV